MSGRTGGGHEPERRIPDDGVEQRSVSRTTAGSAAVVRAAGGVVWRPATSGPEVCLVHRSRYDDWSLPKGKLDPGEHPLVGAVREVAEETGIDALPQVRLPSTHYHRDGAPKVVDYWSMRAGPGDVRPVDAEVDAVRWLPVTEAAALVSYPHDARVLNVFAALPPVCTVLGLVRHGRAGMRGVWSGPDTARPLDRMGLRQAEALAAVLALLRPRRLLAASALRCVQTLGPLAGMLDLPIEVDGRLAEPSPGRDAEECALAAAGHLVELGLAGRPAVLCGQGGLIPSALGWLCASVTATGSDRMPGVDAAIGLEPALARDLTTGEGAGWLLAFGSGRFICATRL